jgi:tight adherence protein B
MENWPRRWRSVVPDALGGINPVVAVAILGFVSVAILVGIGLVTATVIVRPRLTLRRRMENYGLSGGRGGGGAGRMPGNRQRRIQERLQELEEKKDKKRARRNQIRSDLLQAGIAMKIERYLMLTGAVGVLVALTAWAAGFSVFLAIPIGIIAAFGLPKAVLRLIARSRQKKFTTHFANAVDVIVRGIKSGLPVGECLAINGRESPEPVGEEFRHLVEGQKIGLTLEELLNRGLGRIPTTEYKFFAIVLQIQQKTGGNLARTLEGLSNVLRERKKLRDKIKALSSEAKASAMIIGSLPFIVGGMVALLNPDYIKLLFVTTMGNVMLGAGLVWMGLGILVMSKMINFKI